MPFLQPVCIQYVHSVVQVLHVRACIDHFEHSQINNTCAYVTNQAFQRDVNWMELNDIRFMTLQICGTNSTQALSIEITIYVQFMMSLILKFLAIRQLLTEIIVYLTHAYNFSMANFYQNVTNWDHSSVRLLPTSRERDVGNRRIEIT